MDLDLCHRLNPNSLCKNSAPVNDSEEVITASCPTPLSTCSFTKLFGSDQQNIKRARKYRCTTKRIRRLAEPKYSTRKYCENGERSGKAAIEIVRSFEEQTPVRIKLLAYPKVRQLVSSRDTYKNIVNRLWYERFEGLIRKSMLTMYSRLANVQMPEKIPHKKWTKADWERHCEWLKARACPRNPKKPPRIRRKKAPLKNLMDSINVLAIPKNPRGKYEPWCGYKSNVKESALMYEPTERILKLAHVEVDKSDNPNQFHWEVSSNAKKFMPTRRLEMLATPKMAPRQKPTDDFTEFGTIKRALKARTTPRTLELSKAKPRTGEDDEEEDDKPLINPRALKAKPTPRIIELSQPRRIIADIVK